MISTVAASLLLILCMDAVNGARILAIFAAPGQSHMNLKSALLRELVTRGHHVTAISPFAEKTPMKNYDEIILTDIVKQFGKFGGGNLFTLQKQTFIELSLETWYVSKMMCESALNEPNVKKLINSKDINFDLIILEAFFSDCFLPFGYKFKAPIVKFCTFGGVHYMDDWVGNPNEFSYVPSPFLESSDRMNFWERTVNSVTGVFYRLGKRFYQLPMLNVIVKKHFDEVEPHMPHLRELDDTSTSLLLVNSHFSISYPRSLMPNLVQVGGLHVKSPNALPQDIQKYLDEAPHGVIYFSMGSILQSYQFPEPKRKAFLEAFSKLKQKVLWKWETDSLPGQPSNVKLGKWLPQSDILAHPNVLAFITHGGLLSSQEALHRGIPVVGIPIFGDQRLNIYRASNAGYGILLEFDNVTAQSVSWALKEVIENSKYRENAQHLSTIFRDQPLKPLDLAMYWVEYVIRHKGAPHMRSAVLDLSWYQYLLLDVIAVLALVVLSVLLLLFFVLRTVLRKCFGVRKNVCEKKNN